MAENTIGEPLVEKDSKGELKSITWADIKNRNPRCIAAYFTGWNCEPCRGFEEKLVSFYNTVNENEKKVEFIMISSDFMQEDWNKTYEKLPWPAVPMLDERIIQFKKKNEVMAIPMVIVLHNETGERVHKGRFDVEDKGPLPEVIDNWIRLAGGEVEVIEEEIEITINLLEEIRLWKIKVREENILILKTMHIKGAKKMPRMEVYKLFETFMQKKYTDDAKLLKKKKKPVEMPQYLWEMLVTEHGDEESAANVCKSLLLSLQEMQEEQHEYGTIFCRLVQVFHPDPVDLGLSTFDVKTRYNFEKQLKMFMKKQLMLAKTKPTPLSQKLGYDKEEFAEQGGYMPLIDVSDLVYAQFGDDRECGYRVMERLLPDNETKVEFTLFIVCWNMAKKGQQPKDLFKTMDKDGSGSVETAEFTTGIKKLLGVWLSTTEVKNVHLFMDADGTGDIEYEEFMERINYLTNKYKDKNAWLCSKAKLLIGIADEYDQKRYRDFEQLQKIFEDADDDGNGSLEFYEFENLCKGIDKTLDKTKIQSMFQEALKLSNAKDPNVMTPAAFAIVVMKHNIGGYGSGVFNAQNLSVSEAEESEEVEMGSESTTASTSSSTKVVKKIIKRSIKK